MWLYRLFGLIGCFMGSGLTLLAVGLIHAAGSNEGEA